MHKDPCLATFLADLDFGICKGVAIMYCALQGMEVLTTEEQLPCEQFREGSLVLSITICFPTSLAGENRPSVIFFVSVTVSFGKKFHYSFMAINCK